MQKRIRIMKLIAGIGLICLVLTSYATTDDQVRQAISQKKVILRQSQSWNLSQLEQKAQDRASQYQGLVNQIRQGQVARQHKGGKVADGAILFVSLGMPKKLLRQYLRESQTYGMPVVIRGLIHNNFRATMSYIYSLIKGRHLPGISIDPVWFRQFGITQVPALVVTSNPHHCVSARTCQQPFDVVYGNLSIKDLLTKIADDGQDARQVAKTILGEA